MFGGQAHSATHLSNHGHGRSVLPLYTGVCVAPHSLWWPSQTNPGENTERLESNKAYHKISKITKQVVLLKVQNCKNFMETSLRISEKSDDT